MEAVLLRIESLRFSSKKRRGVSPHRVEELRRELEEGKDLLPISVCAMGDGTYVVRDGRHRIQAHLEAGIDCIFAFVKNSIDSIKRIFSKMYLAMCEVFLLK